MLTMQNAMPVKCSIELAESLQNEGKEEVADCNKNTDKGLGRKKMVMSLKPLTRGRRPPKIVSNHIITSSPYSG